MYTARALLFAVLVCMVTVNGRHHAEPSDAEELTDRRREENEPAPRQRDVLRRRRKRWQTGFSGYEYRPPAHPYYENDRRDYYNQPDIQDILRLLDDIRLYVSRPPPPPPQPIYIPYPVPYPVPQLCQCPAQGQRNDTGVPSGGVPPRFPQMDDINQNWGIANDKDNTEDGVYNRPIEFKPIKQDGSNKRDFTTSSPLNGRPTRNRPNTCDTIVLLCCNPTDTQTKKYQCFVNHNCTSTFNSNACTKESINAAIERISKAYSPV